MKQLLILGCSQTKRDSLGLLPAIDRYDGPAYKILRKYLRQVDWPKGLSVAILSAEYGLLGGFTGIDNYDLRMTPQRALSLAPKCNHILNEWAKSHIRVCFSLGKDYLPAVRQTIDVVLKDKAEIFEGGIGIKLGKIKDFLYKTESQPRHKPILPEPGSGKVSYFLPDWDDLLDEHFNFRTGEFSAKTKKERNDKHCCVLMKPKRLCDGVLVSLAQHVASKGPLRRLNGSDEISLSPMRLRDQFGLEVDQSLFGDCGAFSYVNEKEPTITTDQAIALYDLHGFDFGTSLDHIPVPVILRNGIKTKLSHKEREDRVAMTLKNAELFLGKTKQRKVGFIPVGAVQALNPQGYSKMASLYHEMGYRHLALGGLVPLPDQMIEEIVISVIKTINNLTPRPWIHLFGVFRPKLQKRFRELKIDSFDSATYFRKAWLRSNQNYLSANGKWYSAIRVPMTDDARTRKRLEASSLNLDDLKRLENNVMTLLSEYNEHNASINEVLDAIIEYDGHLARSGETHSLKSAYLKTLQERPWENCDCPFCKEAGIHILVFRGSNRNKRRGAHNTLMLYNTLEGKE